MTVSYLHCRPSSGIYFYYRRIPEGLRGHYGGLQFRRKSLQTRDKGEAIKKVLALASADDALWTSLRTPEAKDLGLTTRETREAAQTLVSQWGLSPGDGVRTGHDSHRVFSDVVDIL